MAEALESAVDLAGHLAVGVVEAVEHVLDGAALGRDVQILHGDELRHREAVVHLDQAQLVAGLVDAGLRIGALGGDAGGGEVAAVPGVVLRLETVRHRHLQRLDGDHVLLAEAPGDLRRGDDGAGGAVAHPAAVEQAQRLGHRRCVEHGVDRDLVAQVRLGIARAVVVALDRDVRHGALEVLGLDLVLGAVGGGELGEAAGRGSVRVGHVVEGPASALRQAAVAGILELLDAECERNVGGAGRHGVDGAAEGLGAAGAVVLDARHRNERQPQRHRQRGCRLADVLLLDRRGKPGGVDLLGVDAGVGDGLGVGLHHQVVGLLVPALAELGAAHADDDDLVLDAFCHGAILLGLGRDGSGFPVIAAEAAGGIDVLDAEHPAERRTGSCRQLPRRAARLSGYADRRSSSRRIRPEPDRQ